MKEKKLKIVKENKKKLKEKVQVTVLILILYYGMFLHMSWIRIWIFIFLYGSGSRFYYTVQIWIRITAKNKCLGSVRCLFSTDPDPAFFSQGYRSRGF